MATRKRKAPEALRPTARKAREDESRDGEYGRLLQEAERRSREMAALLEVSRVVASSLDLGAVLGAIVDQLGAITEHTGASIVLFREESFEFAEARSITGTRAQIGARVPFAVAPSITARLKRAEPVIIDDVRSDGVLAAEYRAIIESVGMPDRPPFNVIRSWMAVPLTLKDRVLGALTISWTAPAYFTAEHARLARAFADQAALALENARLYEEMRSSARRFEALSRADSELFRSLDLDTVLQALVDVTVDVIGVDKSMVATWEVETRVMTLRAWRNLGAVSLAYIRNLFNQRTQNLEAPNAKNDRYDDSLEGVIVTEDPSSAPPHLVPIIEAEGIRSMIEIPVVSAGRRPLGFFSVAYTNGHQFAEAEQRLLTALADRAAVAISNAELYERAQQVASLEERQRLARELHDSVSQALYGIALGAQTARAQLDRDPRAAVEPLDYVLSLAEVGMTEMRALIFELRPESLESEGLNAAIRKQVDALQARHGMIVDLVPCDEPDLPLPLKEAIYRIAQESLHNVIKHSRATHVRVVMTATSSEVRLEVADNGVGFDAGGDFPGHLGLKSMRERALRLGGRLDITSPLSGGTRVSVTFHSR
jgi:signal transduction histidine kinase